MADTSWKDYFRPPFIRDSFVPGIVWDSDGGMILRTEDYEDDNIGMVEKVMDAVVEGINAMAEGREPVRTVRFDTVERHGGTVITLSALGYCLCLIVRGWGYLTGYLGLSDNEAMSIQDSLGQFIAECIKNASKEYENEEQE